MRISYCITVNDEYVELQHLYKTLKVLKRPEDEIVVQMDAASDSVQVLSYCRELEKQKEIKFVTFPLNGNFAKFKTNLGTVATGDFIFQIDADEIPNAPLISTLPDILQDNPEVDVYVVPRVNIVEGLTEAHIKKWGWNVTSDGVINWPDYQWRIYRNNGSVTWKNKVHEVLTGHKQFAPLPAEEDYSLYHIKTIDKQERQNNYYDTL